MEQGTTATIPVTNSSNQKSGNGLKIATAIASVVAVCGVGLGVWAIVDANSQKAQIDSLKQQNTTLQEQIAELTAKLNEEAQEDTTEKNDDYIYLEELGIKIKKSDSLPNMVAYSTEQNSFNIKENIGAQDRDTPPSVVTFMKISTCDEDELIGLPRSVLLNINGECYAGGEIWPYRSSSPDYPLTEFLEYVLDNNNYSTI